MKKYFAPLLFACCLLAGSPFALSSSFSTYNLTPKGTKVVWVTSIYSYDIKERVGNDLQIGGWGDYYEGYLWFDVTDMPENAVGNVFLRLYVKARQGDKNERMTSIEVREVTYTNPVIAKGETKAPETWTAERLSYSMRPSSSFLKEVEVTKEGWVWVDITELYRRWKAGTAKNRGFHFVPMDNGNTRTVIVGPRDKKLRPQVVFVMK